MLFAVGWYADRAPSPDDQSSVPDDEKSIIELCVRECDVAIVG